MKFDRLIDVRRGAPRDPAADGRRPRPARAPPREGARHRRAPARGVADPGRQRRVRQGERLVRADDAARPARAGRRQRHPVHASRARAGSGTRSPCTDARTARIVRQCRDLPGQRLFQYVDDDGKQHKIESGDVNDYLREATGAEFTAKDFRTWVGTLLAATALVGARAAAVRRRGPAPGRRGDRGGRPPARQHADRRPRRRTCTPTSSTSTSRATCPSCGSERPTRDTRWLLSEERRLLRVLRRRAPAAPAQRERAAAA